MKEALLKRLEAVEARCKHDPMIVLAREAESGEEAEMSVAECIKRNAVFVRVVSGGNLEELDMLLKAAFDEAWRMV